ncbi:MAG: Flp family type IVb pilin [Bacillota bacterium]
MGTTLKLLLNEEGQGMAEYALILGFIALVAIAGLVVLGPKIRDKYVEVSNNL